MVADENCNRILVGLEKRNFTVLVVVVCHEGIMLQIVSFIFSNGVLNLKCKDLIKCIKNSFVLFFFTTILG